MSNEDFISKVERQAAAIKGLIDFSELTDLGKKAGEMGVKAMNAHTLQGRFKGGEKAAEPYSTSDLPMFFFGEWRYIQRTGNIRINNPAARQTNRLIEKKDVRWVTTRAGKRLPIMKGGYATWLKYTRPGKDLSKVDLTYTGDMLRNLTYQTVAKEGIIEVTFFVRPPHDRKAWYTHRLRNWLTLFDDEADHINRTLSEEFTVQILTKISE